MPPNALGCDMFPEGDVINWNTATWKNRGTRNNTVSEFKDLGMECPAIVLGFYLSTSN